MQEIKEKSGHVPQHYGDRFIPRRYTTINNLSSVFCRHLTNKQSDNLDIIQLRQTDGYWRTKNYARVLKTTLNIEKERVYNLSDPFLRRNGDKFYQLGDSCATIKKAYPNVQEFDWPCKPRVKPSAFPDSTHDLPGFRSNFGPNVLSWSTRGPIAASFKNDLVMWTPDTLDTLVFNINESHGIAYSPAGNILAMICKKPDSSVALQLWDCAEESCMYYMREKVLKNTKHQIKCIAWEPNGKHIACGTIGGSILIFLAKNLKLKHTLNEHRAWVHTVKFSPKSNYFAANDMVGRTTIWCWKSCVVHCRISPKTIFNSDMDWHPWNGTDLAIASSTPAAIHIFNVPSKTIVAYYKRQDNLVFIQTLLFNKISAELLVSCNLKTDDENPLYEILVLASLDQIVDVLTAHEDSISFMVWNANGMQLATASDDDIFFIWKFFGSKDSNRFCPATNKKAMQRGGIINPNSFKSMMIIR